MRGRIMGASALDSRHGGIACAGRGSDIPGHFFRPGSKLREFWVQMLLEWMANRHGIVNDWALRSLAARPVEAPLDYLIDKSAPVPEIL